LNLSNNEKIVAILTIALFFFVSAIDITRAPIDLHQFRQTQTLSTIYNFFINGINVFKPELDTNGKSSVIILEFPVYQAIVAFIMKVFGYHEVIGRLVNILVTVLGAVYLAKITDEFFVRGTFLFTLVLYLFNPSMIFWSSTILIDPFLLGLAIISVYFLFRWLEFNNINDYFFGVFIATIVLVGKLTLGFIPYLAFLLYILFSGRLKENFLKLTLIGIVWLAFIFSWMVYSKYWHGINPHIYTNGSIAWYFGSMSQRIDLEIYRQFYLRALDNHLVIFTAIPIAMTIIRSFKNKKYRIITLSLLIPLILYLIIFINLNYIHTYYQLPLNIVFSVLGGMGFFIVFSNRKIRIYGVLLLLLSTCILSNKFLHNHWVDMSSIKSPYVKSSCEMNIGTQLKNILRYYNVNPEYVGVHLEYSGDCWNGEHALMYFLKERGYVTLDRDDPRLKNENIQLIIDIYKDENDASYIGWNNAYSTKLTGSVNQYSADFFTKNSKEIGYLIDQVEDKDVYGSQDVLFDQKFIYSDLNIPSFYKMAFSFSVKGVNDGRGFFILRTYKGGYSEDNYREFEFSEGELIDLHFDMNTSFYDDYSLVIGSKSGARYKITSPISVTGDSVFRIYEK
tara:strand:- start:9817 stop:11676 length:1860 start_codon:yes stop_codon:yes gene_type:complete